MQHEHENHKDADHDEAEASQRDASIDDVGFEVHPDYLARPRRKPPEPGLFRVLGIACGVGVALGLALYYLKPTPRSAEARPSVLPQKMMNAAPTPAPGAKVELFELPEWDESAHARQAR
jgi:hypothetical protein